MGELDENLRVDFDPRKTKGFGWRVSTSIITAVGWLSFIIIWLFFYADKYSIYQNIGAVIVSLIVFIGVNGAVWGTWAMRMAPKDAMGPWRLRAIASFATGALWVAFLLIWLLVYADSYSAYQNIAVLFVSVLVLGGINGVLWNKWSHPW
ncbi:MAG: hypothetical protein ABR986_06490 [Methanomassiliicoccales archaeon]|jgi:hypothetical protein